MREDYETCRICTRKVKYDDQIGYEYDEINDFIEDANGIICFDCFKLQRSNEQERHYNNMLGCDVFQRYRSYQFLENEWHHLSAQFKGKLENEIRARETARQDSTCWYLIKNLCRLDVIKIAKRKKESKHEPSN